MYLWIRSQSTVSQFCINARQLCENQPGAHGAFAIFPRQTFMREASGEGLLHPFCGLEPALYCFVFEWYAIAVPVTNQCDSHRQTETGNRPSSFP